jgi:iron complex outermembrane receptor protein
VGVVFTPRWVPGLTLNASYFRIEKDNVIRSPGVQDFTTTARFFPELILRDAPTAADIAAGRPGAANTFINIAVNVAGVFTDGVDYRLKYDLPEFGWGRLRLDSSYTWTKRFDSRITPSSVQSSSIDVLRGNGFPVVKQNKVRSSLEWSRGPWAASATGTYGNAYESNTTLASAYNPAGLGFDGRSIPSAFTLDAQVSYLVRPLASSGWRSWLGNTRWTLGALNVLDTSPTIVNNPGAGYYDVSTDPRRRFGYLSVRKTF